MAKLDVIMQEPVLVAPSTAGETRWGHHQFPALSRMPDGSIMVCFTQATGPLECRPRAPKEVLHKLSWPPNGDARYDMTGLDLRNVHLDARGSWEMTLANGIEVRLGRRDVPERTGLFLDVVADIITGRAAEIEYVDMRYSNGFTIGWNNGSRSPVTDPEEGVEKMLASRGTR